MAPTTQIKHHRRPYRATKHALLSLSLQSAIAGVLLSIYGITTSSAFVALPTDVVIGSDNLRNAFDRHLPRNSKLVSFCTAGSDKNDDDKINTENAELLERARKLREEASLMEDDLKTRIPSYTTNSSSNVANTPVEVINKQLEESTWTLSYRFSSQPAPKESAESNIEAPTRPMTFYSGKIDILLRQDGYSEDITKANEKRKVEDIEIKKVWGWDRETSREDDLDYLLFSMDVGFPPSDPELPNQKERYYFQARIEEEAGSISLKEGTITVKKDVTEKTGGRWGFFNVAGILTEFRYCGDFVARASR